VNREQMTCLLKSMRSMLEALVVQVDMLGAELAPGSDAEKEFHCENCGSPNWKPGGMAAGFKQCSDCGALGEEI